MIKITYIKSLDWLLTIFVTKIFEKLLNDTLSWINMKTDTSVIVWPNLNKILLILIAWVQCTFSNSLMMNAILILVIYVIFCKHDFILIIIFVFPPSWIYVIVNKYFNSISLIISVAAVDFVFRYVVFTEIGFTYRWAIRRSLIALSLQDIFSELFKDIISSVTTMLFPISTLASLSGGSMHGPARE